MKFYVKSLAQVYETLKSGGEGLSSKEAESRLLQNGKNKLTEGKKVSLAVRFFKQLADPMIIILLIAAALSGVTAVYEGESFADVGIILFVVLLNAVLGVFQESKAEKAIEALKEMTSATSKVLRDGEIAFVKSEDLVTGDILLLEAGDAVPADARLIESAGLKVEEAALTGESVAVDKITDALAVDGDRDIPLGDRKNMVYMGSVIVYGRGKAVITEVGMETQMGKIADAITQAKEEKTPLQIKLSQLSKVLTFLVLGICVFIFLFSLLQSNDFSSSALIHTFMIAVSLAVAAIPEGLAAVVTIVLSIGVTKMSKRNAVVRKLTAVETLGCTQVICSDKTGTLTQNKMTVVEQYSTEDKLLAEAMALCSDAELDHTGEAVGEPTECALVEYAKKTGLLKSELVIAKPRIGEVPFDSGRKMMSTVHEENQNGMQYVQYTKGAPDELLKVCTGYLKDGEIKPLTDAVKEEILTVNKNFADKALRVLGAAFRTYKEKPQAYKGEALERELVFIGLVGMIDPVRPEVLEAIRECKSAGIRPIMITGDHKDTAVAIAMELGMIQSPEEAITGAQLDGISDTELQTAITNYSVYARVQPEHKVRIVKAWKAKGAVTAMTGDGVNDAPSIKSADIGIGMGITGTDVTKNVADMVLADDNFATIVSAVEEGRRIYDNIRKAIQFLLASNLSEVLSIFAATLMGFVILNPVHILWINLITDTLPALALGMEKGESNIMKRAPRTSKEGVFSRGLGLDVIYQGVVVAALTLTAYFIGNSKGHGFGMSMAFLTMSMAEIFHSYNMRSQRESLFRIKGSNLYLFGAMALSFLLSTVVMYIPFLQQIFELERLSFVQYIISIGLALCIIPVVEIVKWMQRNWKKRSMPSSTV